MVGAAQGRAFAEMHDVGDAVFILPEAVLVSGTRRGLLLFARYGMITNIHFLPTQRPKRPRAHRQYAE
jgi:hypothetical protein